MGGRGAAVALAVAVAAAAGVGRRSITASAAASAQRTPFTAADRPPATTGDSLDRVDTPALLLDLEGEDRRRHTGQRAPDGCVKQLLCVAAAPVPFCRGHRPNRPSPARSTRHDPIVFESNCRKLRRVMEGYPGVTVRPHAKARGGAGCRGLSCCID